VWEDGTTSKESAETSFEIRKMLMNRVFLSDLDPVVATSGWRTVQMNRSVSGNVISIAGKPFEFGIGTHANSKIQYDVDGLYAKFSSVVGIDDYNGSDQGSVVFSVYGDGKELWHSGVVTKSSGAIPVSVNIEGVRTLLLRVTAAGKSIDYDHADWANARLENLIAR
jgi:hypothetical protein